MSKRSKGKRKMYEPMWGMCPQCGGNGCQECEGHGYRMITNQAEIRHERKRQMIEMANGYERVY